VSEPSEMKFLSDEKTTNYKHKLKQMKLKPDSDRNQIRPIPQIPAL